MRIKGIPNIDFTYTPAGTQRHVSDVVATKRRYDVVCQCHIDVDMKFFLTICSVRATASDKLVL